MGGRSFDQDRTRNWIGIDETATNVSGGAQVSLGGDWYGGFGARYEKSNSNIDTRAKVDGDYFLFAGALRGRWGDTTLTTVVTGGFGDFNMKRFINLPGVLFTSKGDQDVDHGAVHARLDHSFLYNGWYARPMVDVAATYIKLDGLSERAAGNVGLHVGSVDEWIFSSTPALELGSSFMYGPVSSGPLFALA